LEGAHTCSDCTEIVLEILVCAQFNVTHDPATGNLLGCRYLLARLLDSAYIGMDEIYRKKENRTFDLCDACYA
jgi:hypothetical protein